MVDNALYRRHELQGTIWVPSPLTFFIHVNLDVLFLVTAVCFDVAFYAQNVREMGDMCYHRPTDRTHRLWDKKVC
jgi:hypothetical protein